MSIPPASLGLRNSFSVRLLTAFAWIFFFSAALLATKCSPALAVQPTRPLPGAILELHQRLSLMSSKVSGQVTQYRVESALPVPVTGKLSRLASEMERNLEGDFWRNDGIYRLDFSLPASKFDPTVRHSIALDQANNQIFEYLPFSTDGDNARLLISKRTGPMDDIKPGFAIRDLIDGLWRIPQLKGVRITELLQRPNVVVETVEFAEMKDATSLRVQFDANTTATIILDPKRHYCIRNFRGNVDMDGLKVRSEVTIEPIDTPAILPAWILERVEMSNSGKSDEGYTVLTHFNWNVGENHERRISQRLRQIGQRFIAESFVDLERDIEVYEKGTDGSERFVKWIFAARRGHSNSLSSNSIYSFRNMMILILATVFLVIGIYYWQKSRS